MVTYTQWAAKKKISSVNWAFGSETVLINEVVDFIKNALKVSELDYCVFDAKEHDVTEISSALRQCSLNDSAFRLIVVKNADSLLSLEFLKIWNLEHRKTLPNTKIIFTSTKEPAVAITAPSGSLIKCEITNTKDLVTWVKSICSLSDNSIKLVLEHTNGNIEDTFNICRKLNLSFPENANIELSIKLINFIESETPTEFIDALFSLDKFRAFKSLEFISNDQLHFIFGRLEYKLRQLELFKNEIKNISGYVKLNEVPGFSFIAAKDLMPFSKTYDVSKLIHCRQVTVLLSSYVGQGVTEGLLETLVVLW